MGSLIVSTGKYIPDVVVPNDHFLDHVFYTPDGKPQKKPVEEIIEKFVDRTGITERRYVHDGLVASDIGAIALLRALDGRDIYDLEMLVAATNYGDVKAPSFAPDTVSNIASRIAEKAGYVEERGRFFAPDLQFGCPGWLQSVIYAHREIDAGGADLAAVVGTETLSRVSDPHDMNSQIYSDGSGAVIMAPWDGPGGVLGSAQHTVRYFDAKRSDVTNTAEYLTMEPSYNPDYPHDRLFLHMLGPNVAQMAIKKVPEVIGMALDQAGKDPSEISLYLLHQANRKLDHDMALAAGVPKEELDAKVPVTIGTLGNSSVATIPTMLDMILRGEMINGHEYSIKPGDTVVMASVGAGMHVNAVVYEFPKDEPLPSAA